MLATMSELYILFHSFLKNTPMYAWFRLKGVTKLSAGTLFNLLTYHEKHPDWIGYKLESRQTEKTQQPQT